MRVRLVPPVLILLAVAGCGGGSDKNAGAASPTPTVESSAAATAGIARAWETFFNAAGTVADHVAVLEKGSTFLSELEEDAAHPSVPDLHSKVLSVVVTGSEAAVTYDLLGHGETKLLPGAQGVAVREGGVWKVSKFTFCQLKSLSGAQLAACE